VEIDRRISEIGKIYGVATTEYTIDATTKYTLGGSASDLGLAGTNEIIVRRAGIYQISASNSFQPSGGAYRSTAIGVGDSGAAWASLTNIGQKISRFTTGFQQTEVYVGDVSLIAGQAVSIWYYTDSITGTNQYYTTENARPNLCVRRIR
jgi:S-adenosylmethionine synthetase